MMLLSMVLFISCGSKKEEVRLNVIYKDLNSAQAIVPISDTLVKPVVYTKVVSLKGLPVDKKKQKFIDMVLPAILVAKHNIERERKRVKEIEAMMAEGKKISKKDKIFLDSLFQTFSTDDFVALYKSLQTHPVSIVLGQAIIECGWGTSRFFKNGTNIFGIWSFDSEDQRMRALKQRQGGKNIYVKKYDNLSASIEDYFRILGKLDAYKKFRLKRLETDDPFELTPYLHNYSEMGHAYTKKLDKIIRVNNLTQYDNYIIDPEYFTEPSRKNLFAFK